MAQDGDSAFDFNAAVAAARRDYPEETAHVTFVNLSAPDAQERIRGWFNAATDLPQAEIAAFAAQAGRKTGFMRIAHGTGKIIVAASASPSSRYLGGDSPAKEAAYAFSHELGHAVVTHGAAAAYPDAAPLHEQARGEIAADVFAVLRGIAQKTMTREDARRLSLSRAMKAPGSHLTSQAVDALLDEKTDAEIAALAPAAAKKLACEYAEKFTPQPGEIEALAERLKWVRTEKKTSPAMPGGDIRDALKKVFAKISANAPASARLPEDGVKLRHVPGEEWLENLRDVCAFAEAGSLTQHVACKILGHALETGKAGFPEEKTFDVTGEKWDAARAMLARKRQRPSP